MNNMVELIFKKGIQFLHVNFCIQLAVDITAMNGHSASSAFSQCKITSALTPRTYVRGVQCVYFQ